MAAHAPRDAALMSWEEIAADLDAGRECLAMVKSKAMVKAELLPKESVKVLARLRPFMVRLGFIGGTADAEVLAHEGGAWGFVEAGLLREASVEDK